MLSITDQTLIMKSSGNSNSPSDWSIARAKLSASCLSRPASTIASASDKGMLSVSRGTAELRR